MTRRAIRLALVLAMAGSLAACGMFDEEERLEGERIPVRELTNQGNVAPASQAAPAPDAPLNH